MSGGDFILFGLLNHRYRGIVLLKYVVTIMVDYIFIFTIVYSNLAFLALAQQDC